MSYYLDTSVFRTFEYYFPGTFPSFWRELERAVDDGQIVSVEHVREEVSHGACASHMADWIGKHGNIFLSPSGDELDMVSQIFRVPRFKALVSKKAILLGKDVADPFLIAAAGKTNGCVVTRERYKPNAVKIPNVCEHFQVDCIDEQELMARLGWQF